MTVTRLALLPLCAALLAAMIPGARALQAGAPPPTPDLAAAAAAGPVSTAAYGARCIGAAHDDTAAFQAAIDTGHTVYAPALGGRCHLTAPLVMKTPGQIFGGDGRARTRIVIEPGFAGQGVFVARTGEPGPVWRDFSVSFVQPDTDDRTKLTRYPPAFSALNTPRFEMDHLGCYVAMTCIDMRGNSGGASFSDLQLNAFEIGFNIDGSKDTIRITNPHWFPFQLTKSQTKLFYDQGPQKAIGLLVGRADDLVICGGLFLGGLGMKAYKSVNGEMSGVVSNTDFDTTSGIWIQGGTLRISSSEFILGRPDAYALQMSDGKTMISSTNFAGPDSRKPLVQLSGGQMSITDSQFNLGGYDLTGLEESGAEARLILNSNFFFRQPNKNYSLPIVRLFAGRSIVIGNTVSDKGTGLGQFLEVSNDNPFNRIIGNASPGWPAFVPLSRKGTYLFN